MGLYSKFQTAWATEYDPISKQTKATWPLGAAPAHQHEVDVEGEDLATHVHTEGLWEVFTQVGKGTCCALEVGTGDFHALGGKR